MRARTIALHKSGRRSMQQLMAGELPGGSMRFMEIGLAIGAIATAILIGLVH